MDLSGTLKTPLGDVSKKTAIIGGVAATIGAIIWYRSYQSRQAAAASVAAAGQSEIDPATGYPYGSPEDAAALSAQAGYQFPTGSGGGGGGGTGTVDNGLVTNAQWSQKVLEYWEAHSLGEPAIMSAALGVYLSGGVPTTDQTSLIQQAVAIAGYPPQAGASGYPPHINTAPPGNTPPPPPAGGGDTHENGEFAVWVYGAQKVDDFSAEIRRRRGHDVNWSSIESRNPGLAGNINWGPSGSKDTSIRKFKKAATYTIPVG
jgi:hypothetical protein